MGTLEIVLKKKTPGQSLVTAALASLIMEWHSSCRAAGGATRGPTPSATELPTCSRCSTQHSCQEGALAQESCQCCCINEVGVWSLFRVAGPLLHQHKQQPVDGSLESQRLPKRIGIDWLTLQTERIQ